MFSLSSSCWSAESRLARKHRTANINDFSQTGHRTVSTKCEMKSAPGRVTISCEQQQTKAWCAIVNSFHSQLGDCWKFPRNESDFHTCLPESHCKSWRSCSAHNAPHVRAIDVNIRNVHFMNATPLYYAIANGNVGLATILVEAGADLTARLHLPDATELPLLFCALSPELPPTLLEVLIRRARRRNVVSRLLYRSNTLLHFAISQCINADQLRLLLRACNAKVIAQRNEVSDVLGDKSASLLPRWQCNRCLKKLPLSMRWEMLLKRSLFRLPCCYAFELVRMVDVLLMLRKSIQW